ncbi:Eco57I restriction-modification methylase domain-containing protein [Falseniella ignava]|uniref:site-specific DNA-methyltransferase (adenine-specific) n=1 Tax=Falseniella ignava CCUG 37419 TaxID=883112 RepID=K1LAP0_9LACT|nr:N-6 DNA methylase [Falseniella ignava]EKB53565.1 hypothetical protein HMPREF9707_01638 [Falseniella ignava CCUG 37419]EKB54370.1 hypothetical protein HMPREF9707_01197 [Falseniella ignava CCUG 37419]
MEKVFQSYYTNSLDITSYMVNKLELNSNDNVLEPSGGEGAFIDELISSGFQGPIDTFDIDEEAIEVLNNKYKNFANISIYHANTLTSNLLNSYSEKGGYYTKIIGNPPYGGWLEYDEREFYKNKFQGLYAKETYTLFLYRCLTLLNNHGKLSFIIPDTFLFLNNHKQIRKKILSETIIEEILIFPSKFFPGVSFGYSNLCIITLKNPPL